MVILALCLTEWPELQVDGPITADFVYIRRHDTGHPFAGSYSRTTLRREADRIRGWLGDGRSMYVHFKDDAEGHAVANALTLKELPT